MRNASGAELNKLSYTVAGQANLSRSLERNAELQIQLDKPAYSGGDAIAVSIRAPYIGAGLITIEREKVFQYQWFKTSTTSSGFPPTLVVTTGLAAPIASRIAMERPSDSEGWTNTSAAR